MLRFIKGGGDRLNCRISLFSTNSTSLSCSSETTERRGKSIYFLKAVFITNSEINVPRLWLREYLKYSTAEFCTS